MTTATERTSAARDAVGRVPEERRFRKALLSQQLRLVRSVIAEAIAGTASGVVPRGLHVGVEDARYAPLAADERISWEAVAADARTAKEISSEVSGYEVSMTADGYVSLPHEDETTHLALTIGTFSERLYPARRALFGELFRITQVGGVIAVLETFVAVPDSPEGPTDPLPMGEFLELAFTASGGRVIVERLESVRYPGEVLRRGALVVFSKLGAPTRW